MGIKHVNMLKVVSLIIVRIFDIVSSRCFILQLRKMRLSEVITPAKDTKLLTGLRLHNSILLLLGPVSLLFFGSGIMSGSHQKNAPNYKHLCPH